ncbi:MAG TPA: DUF2304 domain-containing protein [Thermodesulfovibrionales bacterium]|nr:DUF2304 domain-containing protein [Thermodesulfovibrionales bacterium]
MPFGMRIMIFVTGFFLFFAILELVRRRKFREELSLVWLLIGFGMILTSIADFVIDPIAIRLGISYPPSLVFMVIFFLLVLVVLYFSVVISDLKGRDKELSQKIALMEYRLNTLREKD